MSEGALKTLWVVVWCIFDVAFFWQKVSLSSPLTRRRTANVPKKLYAWWKHKSRTDLLLEAIANARLFEEWEAAAFGLDECLDYDMW